MTVVTLVHDLEDPAHGTPECAEDHEDSAEDNNGHGETFLSLGLSHCLVVEHGGDDQAERGAGNGTSHTKEIVKLVPNDKCGDYCGSDHQGTGTVYAPVFLGTIGHVFVQVVLDDHVGRADD